MLTTVALVLAAAAATIATGGSAGATASPLLSNAAWFEKITVTVAGNGKPQSCRYETNLRAAGSNCEVAGSASGAAGGPAEAQFTRITFERRFVPGGNLPDEGRLELGDQLLGRQVMALAIDAAGAVQGCTVVATSGDMTPTYGCDEAQTEKFEASAAAAAQRRGFLTVLVYGHAEEIA